MESTPLSNLQNKLSSYLKCRAVDTRVVHGLSLKMGCLCSTFLCNNLVHAYVVRLMVGDARKVFDEISLPNVVSWSTMISGYTQIGKLRDALVLFREMQHCEGEDFGEGNSLLLPNQFTFGSILIGCTRAKDLRNGIQIHCSTVKFGVESDTFIAGALIDMYAKCGKIEGSWRVFNQTPSIDVVTWTTMVTGLATHRQHHFRDAAFELFKEMICKGVWPVGMTFASLVKIFDEPKKLNQAKQVHGCSLKLGIEVDDVLESALIAMYGRCEGTGELVRLSVRRPNRDMVSWTSLLVAYVHNGLNVEAIDLFRAMVDEKVTIDSFVVSSVLRACSALEEVIIGKEIHGYAVRNNFMLDVSLGNSMVTLYGRCGEIRKAEAVFQLMRDRDVISWTALLTCYVQNGFGEEALLLFRQMLQEVLNPPIFTITGAVRAASTIASLCVGQQIHSRTIKMGINDYLSVENSLITMYSKCGKIELASGVFNSMIIRDVISWNALIAGFAQHGFEIEALQLFYQMQKEGIKPDGFTFLGILVSCSHLGLVAEGCEYFKLMSAAYELEPKMEHYACMVDLFGRAGKLHDALDFINRMPCDPDHLVWESFLGSCKFYGNIELGKVAAKKILQMRPEDPSVYIILSSIYALRGMWDRKACILATMKSQGVRKEPAKSWVEAKGVVHVFTANDESHPQLHLIYWKLEELKIKMEEVGYVPDTNFILHDIGEEQKEDSLLHHSEKLALAFALIGTSKGSPITIMQNIRCCGDCHSAMKLISKIEDRQIVLRDSNRFHHFVNGACSCQDYW